MKIRRKACESGWNACDSRWKVPTVGHLGGLERDPPRVTSPKMPDGWNFLSAITCVPPTFTRFPSYLCNITLFQAYFNSVCHFSQKGSLEKQVHGEIHLKMIDDTTVTFKLWLRTPAGLLMDTLYWYTLTSISFGDVPTLYKLLICEILLQSTLS